MKFLFFFFLLLQLSENSFAKEKLYTLKSYESTPKTLSQITRIAIKYQRTMLINKLHDILIAGRPSRFVGSPGHLKAREFIVAELERVGGEQKPTVESFNINTDEVKASYQQNLEHYQASDTSSSSDKVLASIMKVLQQATPFEGKNIVWEKKGLLRPQEIIIIGAHYDTLLHDPEKLIASASGAMPGADNNASGVAAALALVEVVAQVNIAKTIRVVFFDGEELARSGSKAYVEAHKEELSKLKLAGFINLLMLGHDTLDKDKSGKSGNMRLYSRTQEEDEKGSVLDDSFAQLIAKMAKPIRSSVSLVPTPRDHLFSSQKAFQSAGFPAVVMTHDWENDFNKIHHSKQDFAETMNFATFHNITQAMIGAVLAWSFDMR